MLSPDVQRARDLVLRWGWNAMAYQILNPGMRLWLSSGGDGVVGYVCAHHYRVVAGAGRSLMPTQIVSPASFKT